MRTYAIIQAAQTLGGASGRTYALFNEAAAMLGCVHVVLVTTATAGNRALVLRVLDATGNALFENQAPNVAASLTSRQNWGAGMVSGVRAFTCSMALQICRCHLAHKSTYSM